MVEALSIITRSVAVGVCAAMLLPLSAIAEDPGVVRPMEDWEKEAWNEERIPADHWVAGVAELEAKVLAGDYQTAEFEAQDLLHQMVELDAGRDAEASFLAQAVALRALAQAGLGRTEDAIWTWHTAENLGARKQIDLGKFGDNGALLARNVLESYKPAGEVIDVFDPGGSLSELQPPGRLKTVYPQRPRAFQEKNNGLIFSEIVFVQGVIDHQGKLQRPVVVDTGGYPTLIYRAFEALRSFRFTPARLGGEAVAVLHVVPVTFADDRPTEYTEEWIELGAGGEAVGHLGSIGEARSRTER